MRYIELNPVRANNMASHPSEYPWSSYRCNALGEQNALVTPHPEYQRLGKTGAERQAAYRQLFRAQIAGKTLDEIREATTSRGHIATRPESIESDPIDRSTRFASTPDRGS